MDIQEAASRFCHLIEAAPTHTRDTFVEQVVRALTALLVAFDGMPRIELPEASPEDDDEPPAIPHDLWHERFAGVGHVLADWQYYLSVDPLAIDPAGDADVTVGDLNDDLADIWRDLKQGLLGLEQGGPEEDICWQWRWGYFNHWGAHATRALAVFHARLCEIEANRMGRLR